MEPTLKEKAESRVEALKLILATADAKLEEAHKAFKLQQGIAYSVAARLKDAERLAQSFGPGTQETLIGQASTDLALAQAKSNVAEFDAGESGRRAVAEDDERRRRAREYDEQMGKLHSLWRKLAAYSPEKDGPAEAFVRALAPEADDQAVRQVLHDIEGGLYKREVEKLDALAAICLREATAPEVVANLSPCTHLVTLVYTAGDPYTECVNCKARKWERDGVWQNTRTRGMEQT